MPMNSNRDRDTSVSSKDPNLKVRKPYTKADLKIEYEKLTEKL